MFERYTEKARRVVFFSRYEASQYGASCIETEHLLLGVVREAPALITSLFDAIDRRSLDDEVRAWCDKHRKPSVSTSVDMPLSSDSRRVLGYAAEEAESASAKHIQVEHLVLGLLREETCAAAVMLKNHGVSLASARTSFAALGREVPSAPKSMRGSGSPEGFADGCIEFVDEGNQRVGIGGLFGIVPRVGEYVRFWHEGAEAAYAAYKVLRVTYDYYPEPPDPPYSADVLRAVRVTVARADVKYESGGAPIDAT